jgi:adenine phosphoribosyltransferase
MAASCQLAEKLGAKVIGLTFLVELTALAGREKLKKYPIHSVMKY